MRANIISIGNSKGIRIPKGILSSLHIEDEVELEVEKDILIIKPMKSKPREGWDKAFKLMHERKEDTLLIEETEDLGMEGWEWE